MRCSEIASEAILDRSRAVVATKHGSLSTASNFWLSMYAYAKPADFDSFEFPRDKVVLRLAEQQVHGVTSLEGQL